MTGIIENYHADALKSFRNYKKLAERAMDQLSDDEFFHQIDPGRIRSRSSSST